MGLDSLLAMELRASIEVQFDVTVELADLFDGLTINDLADRLQREPAAEPELPPRKRGMYNEMAVRNAQAHEAEEARKEAGPLDAATVKKMTVAKLRAALAARGLDTKGLKAALQARLLEAIASS